MLILLQEIDDDSDQREDCILRNLQVEEQRRLGCRCSRIGAGSCRAGSPQPEGGTSENGSSFFPSRCLGRWSATKRPKQTGVPGDCSERQADHRKPAVREIVGGRFASRDSHDEMKPDHDDRHFFLPMTRSTIAESVARTTDSISHAVAVPASTFSA